MGVERFKEFYKFVADKGATPDELRSLIASFKEDVDVDEEAFKKTAIVPILLRIKRDGTASPTVAPSFEPKHEEEALEARKIMGRPRTTPTPTASTSVSSSGGSAPKGTPSGGSATPVAAATTGPTLAERKAAMKSQVDDLVARCGAVPVPEDLTSNLDNLKGYNDQFQKFDEHSFDRNYKQFETLLNKIEAQLTDARNAHQLAVDGAETARLATVENFRTAAAAMKALVPSPAALVDKLKATLERVNATKAMADPGKKRSACVAEDKVLAEITRDANDLKAARGEAGVQSAAVNGSAARIKADLTTIPDSYLKALREVKSGLDAQVAGDTAATIRAAVRSAATTLTQLEADATALKAARSEADAQIRAITAAESKIRTDLPQPPTLYGTEFAALRGNLTTQVSSVDATAIRAAIRSAAAEVARLDKDAVALKGARGEAAKQLLAIPGAESKVKADLIEIPTSYATQFKGLRDGLAQQATEVDAAAIRAVATSAAVLLAQLPKDAATLKAARGEAATQLAALVTAKNKAGTDLPPLPAFYEAQFGAVQAALARQATETDVTGIRAAARFAGDRLAALQASVAALKKARADLASAVALLPMPVPKGLKESADGLAAILVPAADAALAVFDAEVKGVVEEIKVLKTAPGLVSTATTSVTSTLAGLTAFSLPTDPFLAGKKAEITDQLGLATGAELSDLKAKLDGVKKAATDLASSFRKAWNDFAAVYGPFMTKRNDVLAKRTMPDKVADFDKVLASAHAELQNKGPEAAQKIVAAAMPQIDLVLSTDWTKVTNTAKDKVTKATDADLRKMSTQDKLDLLRDLRRTNELAGALSPAQKTLQKKLYRNMGSADDNLEPGFEAHEKDKRKDVLTEVKKVLTESKDLVATIKDWDAYPADQTEDKRRAAMTKVNDWSKWEDDPNLDAKVKADLKKKMAVAKQVLEAQCKKMGITAPDIVFDKPSGPKPVKGEPNRTTTSKGSFNPGTGKIYLNPDPKGAFNEFPDAIDTIIHENTHNYQKKLVEELEAGTLTDKDPRYLQARVFQMNNEAQGYIDSDDKHEDYKGQPVEAHAWKAGGEASKLGEEILSAIKKG